MQFYDVIVSYGNKKATWGAVRLNPDLVDKVLRAIAELAAASMLHYGIKAAWTIGEQELRTPRLCLSFAPRGAPASAYELSRVRIIELREILWRVVAELAPVPKEEPCA